MEFLIWWAKTEYGQVLNSEGRSRIKWSIESHYAEVWRHFDQVADILTGRPKVICRTCLTLLDHPQHKKHGTSAMGKHQKSKSCRQGQKRTYRQTLTTNSIQKAFLGASSNCKKFTTLQLEERLLLSTSFVLLMIQSIHSALTRIQKDVVSIYDHLSRSINKETQRCYSVPYSARRYKPRS